MSTLWQSHTFTVLLSSPGITDTPFLSYDPALSRVRVDESVAAVVPTGAALNTNPGAEADTSGWFASNSTIARSTLRSKAGVASVELTPNGVASTATTGFTQSGSPAVTPGEEYQLSAWVYSVAGWASGARLRMIWLDAANAQLSTVTGSTVAIPAGQWTFLTVTATAPALAAKAQALVDMLGTPPGSSLLYIDELIVTDDVRTSGPVPAGAVRVVERSTDLINWVPVRGGAELPVDGGANPLSDFEFVANSENHYRIRVLVEGELYWTFRDSISVVLDRIWLKPVRRPFLARPVTATAEYSDFQRTGRTGVFPIAGRSLPVAVVDLHESQRWTLELETTGQPAAREMDLVISSGDVFYLHGPADCPLPEGYYVVGDTTRARRSTYGERRYHSLPLTMVASPAAVLEGVTFTWRSMLNRYATWADVAAAGLTWREIDELIGTAEDVVV